MDEEFQLFGCMYLEKGEQGFFVTEREHDRLIQLQQIQIITAIQLFFPPIQYFYCSICWRNCFQICYAVKEHIAILLFQLFYHIKLILPFQHLPLSLRDLAPIRIQGYWRTITIFLLTFHLKSKHFLFPFGYKKALFSFFQIHTAKQLKFLNGKIYQKGLLEDVFRTEVFSDFLNTPVEIQKQKNGYQFISKGEVNRYAELWRVALVSAAKAARKSVKRIRAR